MIITLLTDFGLEDEYVGVMHGVALSLCPQARVVDLSHGVAPQDVGAAGLMLGASFSYFPPGTVHVAVVDPGVGSARKILAARFAGHLFVAPDNGLLPQVFNGQSPEMMVSVENEAYFLHPVSRTFHGRDILIPVGAYLAKGVELSSLGPGVDPESMAPAVVQPARVENGALAGRVVHADRFGNLITNISASDLKTHLEKSAGKKFQIQVGGRVIQGLCSCYADVSPGTLAALVGSRGFLEIAVARGSALKFFGQGQGMKVIVSPVT